MTIACGPQSILLAVTLALSVPLPAAGQSNATCIAYMEADAVYSEALRAALEGSREAGSKAYTEVMLPHRVEHMVAYRAANKAGYEAAKKTGRRCGGFFSKAEEVTMRLACEAQRSAYRATLEAYGVDEKDAEDQAKIAEIKASEDFKRAAIEDARKQRDRAYRTAYTGPSSKVASVIKKLIKADRKRCRRHLER